MQRFHPGLRAAALLPAISYGPRLISLMTKAGPRKVAPDPAVTVRTITVPGFENGPDVELRVIRPVGHVVPGPALFWIHGGGLVFGDPASDDRTNFAFARELGITVVAVRYRFAPAHPGPAALHDVYAGYLGTIATANELSIDPTRIAIGGASAGGGLTAALAQFVLDRGGIPPVFQLLVYPMLDDRTVLRTELESMRVRAWTTASNRYGWTSYLGRAPGSAEVPEYTVPARREDLSGLPPAWVGVGDLDLFHDEDLDYAKRLRGAGVPVEVRTIEGAFHGFDVLYPRADISKRFWRWQAVALRNALFPA